MSYPRDPYQMNCPCGNSHRYSSRNTNEHSPVLVRTHLVASHSPRRCYWDKEVHLPAEYIRSVLQRMEKQFLHITYRTAFYFGKQVHIIRTAVGIRKGKEWSFDLAGVEIDPWAPSQSLTRPFKGHFQFRRTAKKGWGDEGGGRKGRTTSRKSEGRTGNAKGSIGKSYVAASWLTPSWNVCLTLRNCREKWTWE